MFKALSIFVHRFNLLFLLWFINCCIWCARRLCYCCCLWPVCLDQLQLILRGVDWTLQMSAVMYWFLSSLAVLVCVCQKQMWVDACVCMEKESISFTPVSSPNKWGQTLVSWICCFWLFLLSFSWWFHLCFSWFLAPGYIILLHCNMFLIQNLKSKLTSFIFMVE